MKQLVCEMCNSTELLKQDGVFVCQHCGCKYSVEDAKRMMIDGTVDVSGSTVQVDNSSFVQKYLSNARRARKKEDWDEVEKYYNMVEQNDPQNIEAIFYSAYGKLRRVITEDFSKKWDHAFGVLKNSISVLDDYFDMSRDAENRDIIIDAYNDILRLTNFDQNSNIIHGMANNSPISGRKTVQDRARQLYPQMNETLDNLIEKYHEQNLNTSYLTALKEQISAAPPVSACYVATAVYGSYDCPQVWTLRRFRDNTLAGTWYGRAFIRTYYAVSPTLVKWFGHTDWFKKMWKGRLDRMVSSLNAQGVEDTPYQDKNW